VAPRTILALLAATLVLLTACSGSHIFDPTGSPTANQSSPTSSGGHRSPSGSGAAESPTPAETRYIVRAGDTVSGIAGQFGVDVDELMQVNGITDPTTLQVGQTLVIPGVPASGQDTPAPSQTPDPTDTTGGDVSILQLVDKNHPLPSDYEPPDLVQVTGNYIAPGYTSSMRSDALAPLEQMLDAAAAAGYDIRVVSAYRSYDDQVATYNYWVTQLGQAEADRVSAKAGYSEHQLGTTADLGSPDFGWDLTSGFGQTPAGQWLAANSVAYGFVMSYPEGKEDITGYAYEPWHFRYIGVDEAQAWQASGETLNQFLGA